MEIDEVIACHARTQPVSGTVRDTVQRLMSVLGRRGEPGPPTEEVFALLALLGIEGDLHDEAVKGLEQARALGIESSEALPIIQAYARGTARVIEAEADLVRRHVGQGSDEERAAYLDQVLMTLMPLGVRGFDVLRRSLLGATLREDLAHEPFGEDSLSVASVALVDLCGSTTYLATADAAATEHLVDALFEAGQRSIADRSVRVLKYVGDGIFLIGRDPAEVARASFAALDLVAERLPLAARAGIAHGPVVSRAGDCFGLPVNLAQYLTKIAPAGTVLATSGAAGAFPRDQQGRHRSVRIGGKGKRIGVVTLRRPQVV